MTSSSGWRALQSAISFWRESTFSHSQVGLHLPTHTSLYIVETPVGHVITLCHHLVHVLLEAGQKLVAAPQRLVISQTLVVVSVRRKLWNHAVSEHLCSILIGLRGHMIGHAALWLVRRLHLHVLTLISSWIPLISSDSLGEIWYLWAELP